jgi:GT2 family glycosyltransferase
MTSVLVVVLNWNGIEDTKACLVSLQSQTYENYTILIVDNGSVDTSREELKKLTEKDSALRVVYNQKNRGFAGGVNTGIHYAIDNNFDAVALFNNDAIADKNWLSELVKPLNDTTPIVTGLLLRGDGNTIDSTGDFYSTWGIGFPRSRSTMRSDAPESGKVFGATGGATLYSTSLFKEIGLFDETFFAYYEDTDISFRAQLAGHMTYYTKGAVAYHKQGATSNKIPGFTVYQTFKNLPLVFWKNIPSALLLRVGIRFSLLYVLIFGNAIKNGSGWSALKGSIASSYYFWTSALWKRLIIQHTKKVSARSIWSILYHDLPPEQTGLRKFRALFTGKQ